MGSPLFVSPCAGKRVPRRNSIFLYGPTRSGKTTILKMIGDYLSGQRGARVVRVSAENLATELVKSIRDAGDMMGFRHRFDDCDALLVDNIWVLQGKPRTTEEIFLLFSTLVERGKLVMTAWDIPPATLSRGSKSVRELHKRSITIKMEPLQNVTISLEQNKGNST